MMKLLSFLTFSPPWPDAIVYDSVARDFLSTGVFRYKIWGDYDPTYLAANFNNGPLYPALHALMLTVFGTTDNRIMMALNVLFLLVATVNIAHILRLTGRQRLLTVLILCNPLVLNYIGIIRPEFLMLFLFTCSWRALNSSRVITAGLLLGLTALAHQFAIFFIPPAIYLIIRRGQGTLDIIKKIIILGLSCLISVSPYLYYAGQHRAEFAFQLFHNQMGGGLSLGIWTLVHSFVTPLFYPSISALTMTAAVPRWLADGFHLSLIFMIIALIGKWRKRTPLSSMTWDAVAVWFMVNLGCAVNTYSAYVTFTFSVAAIALLRDVYPDTPKALRNTLCAGAILGISQQLVTGALVYNRLFQWEEYQIASACLSDALPPNAKVTVMAYPDPSVQLSNWRPDLDIRRFIDFPQYAPAWAKVATTQNYFITSDDGIFLEKYDYQNTLRDQIAAHKFNETLCNSGHTRYHLWSRK